MTWRDHLTAMDMLSLTGWGLFVGEPLLVVGLETPFHRRLGYSVV
jgi:hypothetical protein